MKGFAALQMIHFYNISNSMDLFLISTILFFICDISLGDIILCTSCIFILLTTGKYSAVRLGVPNGERR